MTGHTPSARRVMVAAGRGARARLDAALLDAAHIGYVAPVETSAAPLVTLPLTAHTVAPVPVKVNGLLDVVRRPARVHLTRRQQATRNRNRMARQSRKRNRP